MATVLEALRVHGLKAELQGTDVRVDKTLRADARLRLRFGEVKLNPVVEIKRAVTPVMLGGIAAQARLYGVGKMPMILLLDYATPQVAERLKALNIPFADTAGNVWLHHPQLLLWVTGRKPHAGFRRPAPVGRAFQETGLKVIFALFHKPELAGRPYRELAQFAGVAHGTVGWVMADLVKNRHLAIFGQGRKTTRKLRDLRRLLDDWCVAYARTLRPKLAQARLRADRPDWWRKIDFHANRMLLGGEAAAARMTKYLQPDNVTLYAEGPATELMNALRMIRADDGEVEILKKFWTFDGPGSNADLVPPILVYADLLATGDPRCLETARMIYDEHLAGFFDPA